MKFKVSQNHLEEKVKKLKSYTTAQEKKVLLLEDDATLFEILEELSDIKADSELEAIYLLQKLREISISDLVEGMMDCPHCQTLNEFQIELNEDVDVDESIPIGIFTELDDIIDSDDLPILECNEIQEKISKNNLALLNLERIYPCRVCKEDIPIKIDIRKLLSSSNLQNIYQEYFLFGKYLHYSNRDVDSLIPFERNILFKLIKKDVEAQPQIPGM